jgi:hypothetical protein
VGDAHEPCTPVERGTEPATLSRFGFTSVDGDPDPQWLLQRPIGAIQFSLPSVRGRHRRRTGRKPARQAVTGVVEDRPSRLYNNPSEHRVVALERVSHAVRLTRPKTRRALDIAEQENSCRHPNDRTAVKLDRAVGRPTHDVAPRGTRPLPPPETLRADVS